MEEYNHIQRNELLKLFIKCRNIDISPEEATNKIIDYINNNYDLKTLNPKLED